MEYPTSDSALHWALPAGPAMQPCAHYFLPTALALGAFAVDLLTPNGVIDGLLYVAAVVACLWVPSVNFAMYTALGLMLPMTIGFILSPSGASPGIAIGNRCVAMGIIWLVAYAVGRNGRSVLARESAVRRLSEQLLAAEMAAKQERVALSDWLRRDISVELDVLAWRTRHLPHRRTYHGFDLRSEAFLLHRAIERARDAAREQEERLRRSTVSPRAA